MPALSLPEPDGGVALEVAALVKRAAMLPRSLRLFHAELEKGEGEHPTVQYVGEGESLSYFASLHGAEQDPNRSTTLPISRLRRAIHELGKSGFLYVEVNRLLAPLLPNGPVITHPWITQKVILAGDVVLPPGRAFEGVYGRKVRKHGFTHTMTTDGATVGEFYQELYLPYITSRFGQAAHARTEPELRAAAASGFLLQVMGPDGWISGVVCRRRGNHVTALAYGLREPHQEFLTRGALSAASYFLIRWAREHGVECVNLLRSRPHREDGVFEHKRRLGAKASWDPWPHTIIGVYTPKNAPLPLAARGVLVRHTHRHAIPFDEMNAALLADSGL